MLMRCSFAKRPRVKKCRYRCARPDALQHRSTPTLLHVITHRSCGVDIGDSTPFLSALYVDTSVIQLYRIDFSRKCVEDDRRLAGLLLQVCMEMEQRHRTTVEMQSMWLWVAEHDIESSRFRLMAEHMGPSVWTPCCRCTSVPEVDVRVVVVAGAGARSRRVDAQGFVRFIRTHSIDLKTSSSLYPIHGMVTLIYLQVSFLSKQSGP